ncbi:ribonuclease HII, partial [Gardnerella vaginalis]
AKVTRDSLMTSLSDNPKYKIYDWAHNKGYGSKSHRAAILEYGPSDLHRISWHLN